MSAGTSTPVTPTGRAAWRASGPVVAFAVALGVVIALCLLVVFTRQPVESGFSIRSAGQNGTRALAELLRQQGVSVDEARDPADAVADAGQGTTLVVADTTFLTRHAAGAVASSGADLVLIAPSPTRLADITHRVRESGLDQQDTEEPDCSLPAASRSGAAQVTGSVYRVTKERTGVVRCYRSGHGAALVQWRESSHTITVIGSTYPFVNARLDQQGNAALALNLLGANRELIWLLPEPAASGGQRTGSFADLVPYPVRIALFGIVVAVALFAVARGRRLGPVIAERLPVVVRAVETTEGRARLYRAVRARGRAANALRAGTISRLRPLLGLPRRAEPVAVIAAVAARSGRDPADVQLLLYGGTPDDDAALVRLADGLHALERQVRRS